MNEQKLDNVIKALELCRYDTDPGQECKQLVACDICPYWSYEEKDGYIGCHMTDMFNDALEALRARRDEPTKFEIKTAISNIDKPVGLDDEQFFAVMANIYHALAKLYGDDIPTYHPSEEGNT